MEFAIILCFSSNPALIKAIPKSIADRTLDFPKLLSATRAVILSNLIFTFDKFLNPSMTTA